MDKKSTPTIGSMVKVVFVIISAMIFLSVVFIAPNYIKSELLYGHILPTSGLVFILSIIMYLPTDD